MKSWKLFALVGGRQKNFLLVDRPSGRCPIWPKWVESFIGLSVLSNLVRREGGALLSLYDDMEQCRIVSSEVAIANWAEAKLMKSHRWAQQCYRPCPLNDEASNKLQRIQWRAAMVQITRVSKKKKKNTILQWILTGINVLEIVMNHQWTCSTTALIRCSLILTTLAIEMKWQTVAQTFHWLNTTLARRQFCFLEDFQVVWSAFLILILYFYSQSISSTNDFLTTCRLLANNMKPLCNCQETKSMAWLFNWKAFVLRYLRIQNLEH